TAETPAVRSAQSGSPGSRKGRPLSRKRSPSASRKGGGHAAFAKIIAAGRGSAAYWSGGRGLWPHRPRLFFGLVCLRGRGWTTRAPPATAGLCPGTRVQGVGGQKRHLLWAGNLHDGAVEFPFVAGGRLRVYQDEVGESPLHLMARPYLGTGIGQRHTNPGD